MEGRSYTTQLQAGLGMIEETLSLLTLWRPGMSVSDLYNLALASGLFSSVSARRLRNIVAECFAPRYLANGTVHAGILQELSDKLERPAITQILFLHTCRANAILADFVRQVFWPAYSSGRNQLSNEEARDFVRESTQSGKTITQWSEGTIRRVAAYLTGACADFGLLESGSKSTRRILPQSIHRKTVSYVAYDLHFAGLGDNKLVNHGDWQLFGLETADVIQELKGVALEGLLMIQAAGEAIRISWSCGNWEEYIDAVT